MRLTVAVTLHATVYGEKEGRLGAVSYASVASLFSIILSSALLAFLSFHSNRKVRFTKFADFLLVKRFAFFALPAVCFSLPPSSPI